MSKKALGRGIDALLTGAEEEASSAVEYVSVTSLSPNKYQPRQAFGEENLQELAQSIKQKGILQPLLVEASGHDRYTIIVGERRFRAAKMAGLDTLPVMVKEFTETEKIEIALIENLQREDLNPVEEARAYRELIQAAGLSQEEVAVRVGKKRSTVANSLRLLKMPDSMIETLSRGLITPGHARAILSLMNPADQELLYKRIIADDLTVRGAEKSASRLSSGDRSRDKKKEHSLPMPVLKKNAELQSLEERLIELFGTKVLIKGTEIRGKIEIEYFSMEDLERIYSIMSGPSAKP